jgi:hypothetical protein
VTFTNHVLTGSAMGIYLPLPVLLPAGMVSHFILDALPHWDMNWPSFNKVLVADIIIGILAFLILFAYLPDFRLPMTVGAFLCSAPDLQQIPKMYGKRPWFYPLYRFHHWIQWSQTRPGFAYEFIWAVMMGAMINSA